MQQLEDIAVYYEEIEAIRLKDYLGLEQEECANVMKVSRQTFQRILADARKKIADALINGKAIKIQGGNYCLGKGYCRREERYLQPYEDCVNESKDGGVYKDE